MKDKALLMIFSIASLIVLIYLYFMIMGTDMSEAYRVPMLNLLIGICGSFITVFFISMWEYESEKRKQLFRIKCELKELFTICREIKSIRLSVPYYMVYDQSKLQHYHKMHELLNNNEYIEKIQALELDVQYYKDVCKELNPKMNNNVDFYLFSFGYSEIAELEREYSRISELNLNEIQTIINEIYFMSDIFKENNLKIMSRIKKEFNGLMVVIDEIKDGRIIYENKHFGENSAINLHYRFDSLTVLDRIMYEYKIKESDEHEIKIEYSNVLLDRITNIIGLLDYVSNVEDSRLLGNNGQHHKNTFQFYYISKDDLKYWESHNEEGE